MGGNVEPRTQSQIARISWCASCDITSELYALKLNKLFEIFLSVVKIFNMTQLLSTVLELLRELT